ncbi:hypothetical protein ACYULU_01915 [Breznakiellaceae bacterium SP9]
MINGYAEEKYTIQWEQKTFEIQSSNSEREAAFYRSVFGTFEQHEKTA